MEVKAEDLREGDEIEITLKGRLVCFLDPDNSPCFHIEGAGPDKYKRFDLDELEHATITRLEKPLAVGDRVRFIGVVESCFGHVQHIVGDTAWVRWKLATKGADPDSIESLSDLQRVSQ